MLANRNTGALSYRDQTSPEAWLMWLKQLVAQDTECWRFTPPLHYNYWCQACSDICRCSWSMSRLIIDHSCISSHMKLQVKSLSSCAVKTAATNLFDFIWLFYASACLHTVRMKGHKTNSDYACIRKLYLTWMIEMSDGRVVNVIAFLCTSAKPAKSNLKKVLG